MEPVMELVITDILKDMDMDMVGTHMVMDTSMVIMVIGEANIILGPTTTKCT